VLILDDILFAPFKGLFWVFRKIHEAAKEELEGQKQQITSSLSELYMELDTGKISEQEFEASEKALLERLDVVSARLREAQSGGEAAGSQPSPPGDEPRASP
jgi:hypothetical protein